MTLSLSAAALGRHLTIDPAKERVLDTIRAKSGPISMEEFRGDFCGAVPGFLWSVARLLGQEEAAVLDRIRQGKLSFEDLSAAIDEAFPPERRFAHIEEGAALDPAAWDRLDAALAEPGSLPGVIEGD